MKKTKWLLVAVAMTMLLMAGAYGCSSTTTTQPTSSTTSTTSSSTTTTSTVAQATSLTGAGATFPQPLYTKWFDVYKTQFGVAINYQGLGSGAGISQITAGTVDFGASDGIMTDDQIAAAQAAYGPILHIPMTSGSEALIYNLQGIASQTLKLDPDVLADIYLGKITKWNDARITAINAGVTLPDQDITVVHRSDGSGTTFIFTNYLSKVSSDWQTKVGNATSVQWPVGVGGEKNAGVAAQVQQIPGSIGYVELAYALQNNIAYTLLKNAAGKYVAPTLEATTAAAVGVTLPADMKIMITNSTNPDAYPISGFTWILAYVNQTDQAKGLALVNMLWWAIHDGQQYTAVLSYAALSPDAVAKAEAEIRTINFQGHPLLNK